jgi:hypothetical protein
MRANNSSLDRFRLRGHPVSPPPVEKPALIDFEKPLGQWLSWFLAGRTTVFKPA